MNKAAVLNKNEKVEHSSLPRVISLIKKTPRCHKDILLLWHIGQLGTHIASNLPKQLNECKKGRQQGVLIFPDIISISPKQENDSNYKLEHYINLGTEIL